MPLSAPASRKTSHIRKIHCEGFQRADDLWDIEAHLTDTKSFPYPHDIHGKLPPGQALHQMSVRVTLDKDLLIHAIEVCIDASPFAICPDIIERFQLLKGLIINLGWRYEVRKRLGGRLGCTHLVELLAPLATTAFQTVYGSMHDDLKNVAEGIAQTEGKPEILDTCHALASSSPVVKKHWPTYYTGE